MIPLRHALVVALLILSASVARIGACEVAERPADVDAHTVLRERFNADWRRFRHRYMTTQGRVVDTGNANTSHSEGQGYAMLFAVAAGDQSTFDKVRLWTQRTLERDDGLHYWRYDPASKPPITDPNAAADGELLIAWALLRAHARWRDPIYRDEATRILRAFEVRLVRKIGPRLLVIPWDGADLDSPTVVNPSYFVFPAMQDIAVALESERWVQLYADCLELVQEARFGTWHLPPDWLAIDDDNKVSIWRERRPYFGYDAIRVPLHLVWAGHDAPTFLDPFLGAWRNVAPERTPAWYNLMPMAATHAGEPGGAGFRAVRALTENAAAAARGETYVRSPLPDAYAAKDYFAASLILLSRLAEIDAWKTGDSTEGADP